MKKFTNLKGFLTLFLFVFLTANKSSAQTASLSPTNPTVTAGVATNFTATATGFCGSQRHYTWTATGSTTPSVVVQPDANTDTQTFTWASPGTYTLSVQIFRTGGCGTQSSTASTTVTVVAAVPPNLWASSSSGSQVSGYNVSNGTYISGPTNIFAFTFPGTTTGGTTSAALGRNAQGGVANGYFYWLPNTSSTGNGGVVEVFAATALGGTPTRIGSFDINGAGNPNDLGFVRLGMAGDGKGWILSGDGTTLYATSFLSNGVNAVTFTNKAVSLVGGLAATFQNGDVCVDGNNNMYALANNGSGVTQIFIGSLSNPTVTLTKKWDLVDPANVQFTGTVNGVAFDVLGSLYITTGAGLYFINQATVNGPAGTVQCSLVQAQTGLQDLASNVFPAQSTLPVRLGLFTVTKQGNNAIIDWITLTEANTDHFEIERSFDGINYTTAGTKSAAGNSASEIIYQYVDPITTSSKIVYYRLKTVDIDAKNSLSKIVALRLNGIKVKNFTVFPNPFTSDLKVEISSDKETSVTIRISNSSGQQIVSRNVLLQSGENIIVLTSELSTLQSGMYMLEVVTEKGKMTQKIIKR